MHSIRSPLALAALYLALSQGSAETVKDRAAGVRSDYAVMQSSLRWIYNDIDRAFAQARKTGKPLLVALRCIPCKSCMGLDVSILNSPDLNPLLDQFVCVRIINANALDLSKFQFDYDLSFSTLFFNGDGSVFGRFGSWQHQRDSNDTSLDSYKAALETALQIHKSYPANRSQLASRQGSPVRYQSPIEIPTLAGKYSRDLDWKGRVVDSCVHCHQIGDALREEHRARSNRMPLDLIYPMPGTAVAGFDL
ncbi:MAG: thioredoxin family protein [Verrucomicrobia bacterium]|nr:thioredoxin family protein [Verrucomicrobiota bacterium]